MDIEKLSNKYMGKRVRFVSGNFEGKEGTCIAVTKYKNAMYGIELTFRLDNGGKVTAQKSEHFEVIN